MMKRLVLAAVGLLLAGSLGAQTPCVNCGTGGGSGTVNAGTAGQLGYYAANGTAVGGLNLGTNLSIIAGTLNATGGSPAAPTGSPQVNAAGSFAGQLQIFYNQPGDTISSIESACASIACVYIVTTPQTISLAADHGMANGVILSFEAGGVWTVNGAHTLFNIAVQESSTLTQHFAGTSTLKLASQVSLAPIEWFGGVGDGVLGSNTGTDNTAAWTECEAVLTVGQCLFQAKQYRIAAGGPTITANNVGVAGTTHGYSGDSPNSTIIFSSSSTGTMLAVDGGGPQIARNKLNDFTLERAVATGVGSIGLRMNNVIGAVVQRVLISESASDYDLTLVPAGGEGVFEDNTAIWCQAPGTPPPIATTVIGFNLHGDGSGFQSMRGLRNTVAGGACSAAINVIGTNIDGVVWDLTWDSFETASVSYGVYINGTHGQDVFFKNEIHDGCFAECVYVNISGGDAGITFDGGMIAGATPGETYSMEVVGGGVNVTNMQFRGSSPGYASLYMHGVGAPSTVVNNTFGAGGGNGLLLSSAVPTSIVGNRFGNLSGPPAVSFVNSSNSTIQGNTIVSSGGPGIALDSSSNNNRYVNFNTLSGGGSLFVDAGSGNQFAVATTCGTTMLSPVPLFMYNMAGDTSSLSGCTPTASTTAYDLVGGYANATWTGTPAGGVSGTYYSTSLVRTNLLPYAGTFNGTDDYLRVGGFGIGGGLITGAQDWSMFENIYINTAPGLGLAQCVSEFSLTSGGGGLFITNTAGVIQVTFSNDLAGYVFTTPITVGAAHKIGFTISSGTTLKIFVDGVSQTFTLSAPLNVSPNEISIGAFNPGSGYIDFFNGQIGDVQVYNTALTAPPIW